MTRRSIHALIAVAILAVVILAPGAISFGEEEPGSTETTMGFEDGREPAVVLSDGSAVEEDPAWTFRYLVPTLLVASGLALFGYFVWYGFGVKGRYRVVR